MSPRSVLPASVCVFALAAPAVAHADRTITFKETNKGATFNFIDNPPKAANPHNPSISPGDLFVLSNPLVSSSGAHLGVLRATCTVTKGSSNPNRGGGGVCYGVMAFKNGAIDLMVSLSQLSATTTTGGIVGGTGTYAGASGSFKSVSTRTGANDTLTLLG